jgi:hypothetical protein
VNLPEDYKIKIKTWVGKLAKSGRQRRMTMTMARKNSRGLGKNDLERGPNGKVNGEKSVGDTGVK